LISSADKVFLTLAEGSENHFIAGESFDSYQGEAVDAAIYSKEDLTVNGPGALNVVSPAGHGIVSKDDLKITGGVITVSASLHARIPMAVFSSAVKSTARFRTSFSLRLISPSVKAIFWIWTELKRKSI
jgi:hypothetical protein